MKQTKSCMFLLALFVFVISSSAQMRVHLINVGQGNATLIEFPCAAILVDAGGESSPLYNSTEALKTYLEDFFADRPDLKHTLAAVYLTHPHKDHTLGVPVILEPPYVIKNAITNGLEVGSGKTGQIKLHRLAQAGDSTTSTADDIGFEAVYSNEIIGNNGFTNAVIDPVNCSITNPVIKILWGTSVTKPTGWTKGDFENGNNHSLVIRIEYGSSSLLIIGDLEDVAQKSLLAKYNNSTLLDADVYMVGHHGSKNGTLQELLNKITPQMALIGFGDPARENSWTAWAYGHPNKGILDMLQNKVSAARAPIQVLAGLGAKQFVNYNVTKAIYATGWDDHVVLEADSAGRWSKVGIVEQVFVNINTAAASELESLPGIGPVKAKAIIDHRKANGTFKSIEEIQKVSGIGPATINLIRAYIKL